jgi:superfamily I DNA/RNA helicase
MPSNDHHSWGGLTSKHFKKEQKDFLIEVHNNPEKDFFLTGVAGSGKTFVAAYAAAFLKNQARSKVLILAYTKLLTRFIRDGWKSKKVGIDVLNYDDPDYDLDDYDTVIVDESQDLKKGTNEDKLSDIQQSTARKIWMGDPSQQLYADAKGDDSVNRIKEFDPTHKHFSINYRNTISVAELAKCFIYINSDDRKNGIKRSRKVKNFIQPILKNPRQVNAARNQPTVFITAKDEEEEFDAIATQIKSIRKEKGTKPTICIAHPTHARLDKIESHLKSRFIRYQRIPFAKNINSLPNCHSENLILLSTIHSLKGLEMDYVFFPMTELSKLNFRHEWDEEIRNNLLFVLFTRARERVWCSCVNTSDSFVYREMKAEINEDFVRYVNAADLINGGSVDEPESDIEAKLENFDLEI